jgi:hypothetical protein
MATTKIVIEDGASATIQKIGKESEKTSGSVNSLRKQMKELNLELQSLDPEDARYDEVAAKLGSLKDQMAETADAVKSQTGPAFEGMNNTFGMMSGQIQNLDFDGLGKSLTAVGSNVKKVDLKTLQTEIGGLIKGFANLGKALLANPIFLIAAAIVGIIAYWDDLQALWNSAKIDKLEKAKVALDGQAVALERQLNIQKKLDVNNKSTYDQELKILQTKKLSADKEVEIANLKGDTEAAATAIEKREQAVYDIKLLQAEEQGKINKALEDARRITDPEYDALKKREAATKEMVAAKEKIVEQEVASLRYQNTKDQLIGNELSKYNKKVDLTKIDIKNGALVNKQEEKKGTLLQIQKSYQEQAVENKKEEIDLLQAGIDKTNESIKTAEQLKAEADAQAKAEERKRKAIEAAAKLKEDIKGIEQRISEVLRSQMDDYEKELFSIGQVQAAEIKRFQDAKKSAKEMANLKAVHEFELQLIMDKYDKIEEDKAKEKLKKEQEDAQARIVIKQQELLDLQALIDKADEENQNAKLSAQEQELRVVQDKYFELKTLAEAQKLDTSALVEAERREKQDINDKYDKEELDKNEALVKAKHDSQIEWAEKGAAALQNLGDAVFATQLANVVKGSKEEENLRRKQFKFNKALQLGGAIIDTAKAAVASLAQSPVAIGPVPNPAGIASLALVGITGAATLAKIAATQFEGGGGGTPPTTASSGGGGAGSVPPIDMSFLRNRPDQQQPPFQAYVVSGQVASSMEAQQLIKNQSRL